LNKINKNVFHLFVGKSNCRDKHVDYLRAHDVEVLIHYPFTIQQQKAFHYSCNRNYDNSNQLVKQLLSLPCHPFLKENELEQIVNLSNKFKE